MANAAAALDLFGKRMSPGITIDDHTLGSLDGHTMIILVSMRNVESPILITPSLHTRRLDRYPLGPRAMAITDLLLRLFQQISPLLLHLQMIV